MENFLRSPIVHTQPKPLPPP